jgi:hypothetical protein
VPFHGFFFLILFSRRKSEAAMSKSGGGGIVFFRVPNRLQGCGAMDEARGGEYYTYIKASVVQWNDIRPWQPRSSFRVRRSSVECRITQKESA